MELLLIGAVGFFIASQLLKWATPYYIKMRLRKGETKQSARFYRQQIKSHRQLIRLRRAEDRSQDMLITTVIMCSLFMTAPLLLYPVPSVSGLIIFAGILEMQFYGKHWVMRHLPLYTFFSVENEPFLFDHLWKEESKSPIYKRKLELANREMVRIHVLKDFVPAKQLAKDLQELDASIFDANKVIREMSWSGVETKDVEVVRQQAIDLSASMKKRLSVYPDLLLHLLNASALEYQEVKEKEEAGERASANMMKAIGKLTDVQETRVLDTIRNPAIEDMLRIIESADVDSETRILAEKTLQEIQERMNQETEEKEEQTTLSNALASIQTARKLYSLDSEQASAS